MNLKGKSKQILAVVLATVLICGAILFFALSNRQRADDAFRFL